MLNTLKKHTQNCIYSYIYLNKYICKYLRNTNNHIIFPMMSFGWVLLLGRVVYCVQLTRRYVYIFRFWAYLQNLIDYISTTHKTPTPPFKWIRNCTKLLYLSTKLLAHWGCMHLRICKPMVQSLSVYGVYSELSVLLYHDKLPHLLCLKLIENGLLTNSTSNNGKCILHFLASHNYIVVLFLMNLKKYLILCLKICRCVL